MFLFKTPQNVQSHQTENKKRRERIKAKKGAVGVLLIELHKK
jgi:hypothetical protein